MNRNLLLKSAILMMIVFAYISSTYGQSPVSIHEQQNREFGKITATEQQWDSINKYQPASQRIRKASQCSLKKVVFGWHPYWGGTYYNEYDYSLLSDIAYFSYEVDPNTGSYSNIHSWKTTAMIDQAKAAGTRVSLAVTLFSGHRTFFASTASRQTLIDSLVSLVKQRSAQGVNIDFEAVPSSQRDNLTQFMKDLGVRFHTELPGSVVSIALPSVDWGKTFNVAAMAPYVDLFIIMGYDYYYSGSAKAGPVSPKNNGQLWTPYDVTRSVRYYLQNGVPATKLCLGVPYYGYDWPTSDDLLNSNSTGSGTARIYKDAMSTASDYGRQWDKNASVPYFTYLNGNSWRQCWYDDATSLGYKYDMVNVYNIAGIGIWALGYDRTTQDLWNVLREKFSNCGNTSCSGYFTDMGGPAGNYFTNDDYTFTLSKSDTNALSAVFTNFSLTSTDTFYAYAGASTSNLLIGKYSGTQKPGIITSKAGDITFRFVSNSQNQSGWEAFWNCGKTLLPEVLTLLGDSIAENSPAGTLIGHFQVNDTIVAGCQILSSGCTSYFLFGTDNTDNSYFRISGDSLFTSKPINYEKQNKFRITIMARDWQNHTIWNNFDIKVLDRMDDGVRSYSTNAGINIFPIPSTGIVNLITQSKTSIDYIEIFDFRGVKIRTITNVTGNTSPLDLSSMPSGVYLLLLRVGNGWYAKKFVINK